MFSLGERKFGVSAVVDVVYDRNHYFGLGPISKPKPKLANTVTNKETTFQRGNLVTNMGVMGDSFSFQKRP